MTINERMTAAGIPGRPYTIAAQLDWAAAELDRLEAQLNFSNATITELRGQLEKMAAAANTNVSYLRGSLDYMTAYRDGLYQRLVTKQQQLTAAQEREAAYAEYERKLEAIVMWLERNEPSVFARGLWDAINE